MIICKFLIVFAILFLSGCSDTKLSPLGGAATILAFGDSLTLGKGVAISQSYPAILTQLSGLTVINAGVSGELTQQGLERFSGTIDEVNPQLIVLLEGGNDILRNKDLALTKKNLEAMIVLAQAQDIAVVLIGVPRKTLFSTSAGLYGELAEKYGLVFDDNIISSLLKTPKYKSDAVHFNALGYKALAERIHQLLIDQGAIE